ncbi:helix-turn-helix domain-containing protein [Malaciobacter marinus]|uniref:Transcriptional regulator, AraC family n=1 Tax=Malaciobacter marinus TaxID=505249 RepID=A0A347TN33_9BACT|nr:AraC family transcriptional regulator [Malaciobacter marinus]AXX88011.1 transcriptional regulator, AraC family [Malaciobacter marinus]PHO16060.1 hypothetical protein CPH92_03770 [Malaciobacter marinus]
MTKTITFENIEEINQQNSINSNIFEIPKNLANGEISIIPITKGLYFHKFHIDVKEDFIIENKFESTLFSFSAFLNGEINYENKDFKIKKTFKPNHLAVSALNQENGKSFYKKGSSLKIINIVATNQFIKNQILQEDNSNLNTIIENLNKKPFFEFIKDSPCTFDTLNTLNTIFNTTYNNKLDNLLLQSQTLELLYNWFNSINKDDKKGIPNIEKEYLNKVLLYIDTHLFEDMSLKELAKVASTNETKLQENFKLQYNSTVFAYIINKKLEEAKKLLETNNYSINEISKLIGYKHQSNFTTAFFKRFNISPKKFIKNKEFYF